MRAARGAWLGESDRSDVVASESGASGKSDSIKLCLWNAEVFDRVGVTFAGGRVKRCGGRVSNNVSASVTSDVDHVVGAVRADDHVRSALRIRMTNRNLFVFFKFRRWLDEAGIPMIAAAHI